jgi:AraC-like DNA-binding protein
MRFYNSRANYKISPNYHDYFEIFIVYEGAGAFKVNKRIYEFNSGDIFLIGSSEVHNCLRCDANTKTIEFCFLPEVINYPGSNQEDFIYLKPFCNHDDEFEHRICFENIDAAAIIKHVESLYRELLNRNTFYHLAVKNQLRDLLLIFARYYEQSNKTLYEYEDKLSKLKRLRSVVEFIRSNYQEHLSLSTVADTAFMSREHFCRLFKQATGLTFTKYLSSFRIEKAKYLIVQNVMPITNVAYEVGFENYSYFYKVFERLVNMSPTEFRNTHLMK